MVEKKRKCLKHQFFSRWISAHDLLSQILTRERKKNEPNEREKKTRFSLVLFSKEGTIFIILTDRSYFWKTTNWPNSKHFEWIIISFFFCCCCFCTFYSQIESSKNIPFETRFCIHVFIDNYFLYKTDASTEPKKIYIVVLIFVWTGIKCFQ